jgi:DivIVA domain-containing protein
VAQHTRAIVERLYKQIGAGDIEGDSALDVPKNSARASVRATTVKAAEGSRGYSPQSVDSFLRRVEARLGGRGSVSADDVRRTTFRMPSLYMWGYDEDDEVNNFVDRVAATIADLDTRRTATD